MRKEHLQSKRASSSPGLMVLAGHLTLDSGSSGSDGTMAAWQRGSVGGLFRGRIWSPSPSQAAMSLGTRGGTQGPAPSKQRATFGPVWSVPSLPCPVSCRFPSSFPSGPIEFGRVRSTALATLAACFSPPPPRVEVKYRGPGMGGQRHGPDLHFQPGAGALLGTQPASPQQTQSRSPSCAGPGSNQGPSSSPPVSSLRVSRARRKPSRRAGKQAVALCMCARACVGVCVPAVVVVSSLCLCVRVCVCVCECERV